MDKVKGFLKDTFRTKGQDQELSDDDEPQEYVTEPAITSQGTNTGGSGSGGGTVGFGGVSFSDDRPEEPPKRGLRFADFDDEKPKESSSGGWYIIDVITCIYTCT